MRVAIVGSRECGDHAQRKREIMSCLLGIQEVCETTITVVSGGALGIDSLAHLAARDLELYEICYRADWERFGKRAGFLRNQQIVDNCDIVHAWWNGKSRGTKHTIDLAKKAGKPVTIHMFGDVTE